MTPYSGSFITNSSKQRMGFTLCLMWILSFANSAAAQSSGRTLERVEEDWVALLAEPESATTSPQIMNFISPIQSTSGIFGLVQVNHRGAPDFPAGGLQVQGWVGSWLSGSANVSRTEVLSRNSDAVRYTIAMQKVSQGIRFRTTQWSFKNMGPVCHNTRFSDRARERAITRGLFTRFLCCQYHSESRCSSCRPALSHYDATYLQRWSDGHEYHRQSHTSLPN